VRLLRDTLVLKFTNCRLLIRYIHTIVSFSKGISLSMSAEGDRISLYDILMKIYSFFKFLNESTS
jgi:hypothetical protein